MFGMAKTLIVVYKDEMLINQLKKMVETNDDIGETQVVGTRDNSINIVAWTEKVWLSNKKAGNIKDKVLFLGDIKGSDALIPVVNVKFNDCGVKYGWAGNQAAIFLDWDNIKESYPLLIKKLSKLPVPEIIKQPVNTKLGQSDNSLLNKDDSEVKVVEPMNYHGAFIKMKDRILKGAVAVVDKTGYLLRDKHIVRRQMLFFGVVNLYLDGLEEFMNA